MNVNGNWQAVKGHSRSLSQASYPFRLLLICIEITDESSWPGCLLPKFTANIQNKINLNFWRILHKLVKCGISGNTIFVIKRNKIWNSLMFLVSFCHSLKLSAKISVEDKTLSDFSRTTTSCTTSCYFSYCRVVNWPNSLGPNPARTQKQIWSPNHAQKQRKLS